jgi:polyisoprenoid-binding protein YceI
MALLLALAVGGPIHAKPRKEPTKTKTSKKKTAVQPVAPLSSPATPAVPMQTRTGGLLSKPAGALADVRAYFLLDQSPTLITLRMNHNPLGRFDTWAENALHGKVALQKDNQLVAKEITLDVDSLRSPVPLRDRHMKTKYLDMKTYPKLALIDFRTQLASKDNDELPFTARLRVNNVEQPIQGTTHLTVEKQFLKGTARFTSSLDDFHIARPQYLNVGADPQFEILAEFNLVPELNLEDIPPI